MKITRIDPWTAYRAQMKQLRKKYAQESLLLQQQVSLDKANQATQRLLHQQERIHDIKAFKAAKKESMLSVHPETTQSNGRIKVHKLFNMTMDELKDYYACRRADRFARALNSAKKTKEKATNSLLYLFHESKNFVTYGNMEEKLEIVTTPKTTNDSNHYSIDEMISSKVKKSDLHVQSRLSKRRAALEDSLKGTVAGGNLGKDQILEIIRKHEESGSSPMMDSKKAQKLDLESVLDKMCS